MLNRIMKDYYTVPQAAKICSVNSSTMYRWVISGKIKSHSTPGGHKRILQEDLKSWLEDNEIPYDPSVFKSGKERVLIVDDELSIHNYLKKILSGVSIDLEFALDGFEAGKKLVQFKPDLMILDLFMPNMDGFDVCKKVKSDPATCKTKVLILSGYGTEENRDKAILAGADAFLHKPSSKNEILECVRNLLIEAA